MFQNKKFIALVPARAGSKGIPGKNCIQLAGRPLIDWTLQAAQNSRFLDACFCSTDDPQVQSRVLQYACRLIKRPAELAQDHTPMKDVLLHALPLITAEYGPFDYLVLLQPTSPLRTAQDIDNAIRQIVQDQTASLASAHPLALRAGLIMCAQPKGHSLYSRALAPHLSDLRRQDAPPLYYVNGAIYIWQKSIIRSDLILNAPQSLIVLPPNHALDIDSREDLAHCEQILKQEIYKE